MKINIEVPDHVANAIVGGEESIHHENLILDEVRTQVSIRLGCSDEPVIDDNTAIQNWLDIHAECYPLEGANR